MGNAAKIVVAVLVCLGAGFLGSIATAPAIGTWYAALAKPSFTPPGWLFGPAWTLLYVLMGVAAGLVWGHAPGNRHARAALLLFAVQLVLNVLWSFLFFGGRNPGAGLVEIVLLWLAILATLLAFGRVFRPAAWLLVPYLLWVTFATALNFGVWRLNG